MIGLSGQSLVVEWAVNVSGALVLLGIALAFCRLVKGPTLPDRVVSVDLITILAVALAGLFAVASHRREFIDIAVALALVAFLATVAFAWYADRRTAQFDENRRSGKDRRPRDAA